MEQEFVRNLSAEARYFRFMRTINELSPEMLVSFTQLDYSREMAMIAVLDEGKKRKQIGVARYIINPDGESCEFALTVSDEYHNQGIGSLLMDAMMDAARIHGVKVIEGEVLANNNRMLSLMKELGFSTSKSPDDPSVQHVERWL